MAIVTVPPTRLDIAVAKTIAAHTGPRIERTAQLLTWGADEHILCALAAGWWLFCRSNGAAKRHASDHILVTTLVASALPHILKAVFDQERPDRTTIRGHWRGIPFSGKRLDAFPSGHAVHIGALASAASVLPPKQRNLAWGLGGALVLTRIVLLAHWFSDVAAGLALGSFIERLIRQLTGMADREKRRIDARRISGTFGRALSAHILLTPSRSTFAVMIARPGRPGIHDGTEFALQGFKNRVGEAAAI